MYLIVGLGNPGAQYAHTRHNVGFDVVDTLARKLGVTIGRERDEALLGECFIAGQKTILALPQTYMNLSGEAVSRLVRWYRLPPENLMVVYDDVDLPQGAIRIRKNGSWRPVRGPDRKSTRLNSSHRSQSRMPSSA